MSIKERISCLLFFALAVFAPASNCAAQFLQTDLATYQLVDPFETVVVVTTPKGLFVGFSVERDQAFLSFDLQRLAAKNSRALFISYANNTVIPEKVILPGENNSFRIRGTFTLTLGTHVRVAVAVLSSGTVYTSIASSTPDHEAVIGFVGRQVVVNRAKADGISTLEADPLSLESPEQAATYTLEANSQIYASGSPLTPNSSIGILARQESRCLGEKLPVISKDDIGLLTNAPKSELDRLLKKRTPLNGLGQSYLVLNTTSKKCAVVDYNTGALLIIKDEELNGHPICLVEPLSRLGSQPKN